jgi:Protein of unknown function (DUF1573)
MKQHVLLVSSAFFLLASCDVRKKDKVAIDNELKQQVVIKDPTTVQIIDSVYNFNKATDGEVVEYSFRFKNTGTKPLIITNASAQCGCTVPEKPEKPIAVGDTGFIKVKFNSTGRVGNVHKTITVTSNAEPAFPDLLLKGEVVAKKDADGNPITNDNTKK